MKFDRAETAMDLTSKVAVTGVATSTFGIAEFPDRRRTG